jgi:hypothetical protein
MQGGAFSPSSFSYTLTAPSGSAKYSITNVPSRLTASSTSGSLTTAAKTITFKIASGAANKLTPSTYLGSINFNNTTTSQVDATDLASLTVAPKDYTIKLSASPGADDTVGGEIHRVLKHRMLARDGPRAFDPRLVPRITSSHASPPAFRPRCGAIVADMSKRPLQSGVELRPMLLLRKFSLERRDLLLGLGELGRCATDLRNEFVKGGAVHCSPQSLSDSTPEN